MLITNRYIVLCRVAIRVEGMQNYVGNWYDRFVITLMLLLHQQITLANKKTDFLFYLEFFLRYLRQNSSLYTMACKTISYSIQFFQNAVFNMSK